MALAGSVTPEHRAFISKEVKRSGHFRREMISLFLRFCKRLTLCQTHDTDSSSQTNVSQSVAGVIFVPKDRER